MKRILRVLRKTEMLLLTASLKADRYLGMGGRPRPPLPVAVRVASRPLRSAAVLAIPIAALAGSTFGAFTDWTRFLQAVLFGTGLMLFLALCLRLERLTQLHYERVGYDPAPRLPEHHYGRADLREDLAHLCKGWVVLTVLFWCVERVKGTPVSWLVSGVSMALALLCIAVVGYMAQRKSLKRQRGHSSTSGHLPDPGQSHAEYDWPMRRRSRVPFWIVLLCLASAALVTSYATRTVRPHCAIDIRVPPADSRGNPLMSPSDWQRWTGGDTDAAYFFLVGAGRCKAPEPRWRLWLD